MSRLIIAWLALACGCAYQQPASTIAGNGQTPGQTTTNNADTSFSTLAHYTTIGQLHADALSTTCSLNNGVCHNSKEYPDMHTLANLLDAVNRPCGLAASDRTSIADACEGQGDHLVIPSVNLDAEIQQVTLQPTGVDLTNPASYGATSPTAVIRFTTPITPSKIPIGQTGIQVTRGIETFSLSTSNGSASVQAADAQSVTLTLSYYGNPTFLDDRVYPWNVNMVRVADLNGNGILGRTLGISLLTPGDPLRSFIFLRLTDVSQGKTLMPLVCRTWDTEATRALGCWIEGLKVDSNGAVSNADDPIDYDHCDLSKAAGLGDCVSGSTANALFTRSCASCHNPITLAGNLDLSTNARMSLVNQPSHDVPSMMYVSPGNPDMSYVMCKIDPNATCRQNAQMPQGAQLASDDIALVRNWILNGAN